MKLSSYLSNYLSSGYRSNNSVPKTKSQVVWYGKDKNLSPYVLEEIKSLNETGTLILETIIRELSRYDIGYFSQETIAKKTGTCRKTVNKYCKLFDLWGIVTKQKRYKKTCLYKISSYILYEEIIKMLAAVIGAFSELLQTAVTGIRNLIYIYKKNYQIESDYLIEKTTLKQKMTEMFIYFTEEEYRSLEKLPDDYNYYEKGYL